MLAADPRRAGYRTGLFTSPHLCRVEERFQVDGRPITRRGTDAALLDVARCVERPDRRSALGPLDVLRGRHGGRLPPLRPPAGRRGGARGRPGRPARLDQRLPARSWRSSPASASTTRSLLGDRLASIAAEKAGIVKPGRPAVSGAHGPGGARGHRATSAASAAPRCGSSASISATRYEPGQVARRRASGRAARAGDDARRGLAGAGAEPARRAPGGQRRGRRRLRRGAARAGLAHRRRGRGGGPGRGVLAGAAGGGRPPAAGRPRLRPQRRLGRRPWSRRCRRRSRRPAASLVFAGSGDKDLAGMFRVLAPHFAHAFLTRYTGQPAAPSRRSSCADLLAGRRRRCPRPCVPTPPAALDAARGSPAPTT